MTLKARFTLGLALMILGAAIAQGQPGPGGKGKGKGPGGFKGPGGGGPDVGQLALDRLDLRGKALDNAQDVLDTHNRVTRKMLDRVRQDLLSQIKQNVSENQYLQFRDLVSTPQGPGGPRGVTSTDLVEHVMAYDKNKLGRVSKEDLPERMQHLIEKGDLNKDGYLDREEVTLMALKLGQGQGQGRGPTRPFTAADADRALSRLGLTGTAQEKSRAAVDVYKEASRKLADERRADLIVKMKGTLSEDQHRQFSESIQTIAARRAG